jgi:hypothetical protein
VPRRRISLLERDRLIADAVASLPGPVALRLLETLMAEPADRAARIGDLYADGRTRALAELLIDLEENRALGLDLAQALKGRGTTVR